jgi:dTDP-glucose 4,6-dehydratase
MARIVVTGAAGFLGSHLCDALIDRGDEVVAIDNLVTGSIANVEHHLAEERFVFRRGDVTNHVWVPGPVDVVMHLASPASPVDYMALPIQTLKVGSLGTHNTLGLAKEKGARYLLASTSEVYGQPEVHPQPETYWGHVNPVGPRGVYDEAKRFAEALTMAYHRAHGLAVRIVRIHNTYGPRLRGDDGRVVSTFFRQALAGEPLTVAGDGAQTRSFCYVSDMVAGILGVLDSDYAGPVNVGNPDELTVLDLAAMVSDVVGVPCRVERVGPPEDDPVRRRPDISLIRSICGWRPVVPMREGLERTLAWYRSTPAR